MNLDKDSLKVLRGDIDKALDQIKKKHDLAQLRATNVTYDPTCGAFTFKLEGLVDGAKGKEAAYYDQLRRFMANLPPRNTTFKSGGIEYVIIGANATGSKVLTQLGDKKFWFKIELIEKLTARAYRQVEGVQGLQR